MLENVKLSKKKDLGLCHADLIGQPMKWPQGADYHRFLVKGIQNRRSESARDPEKKEGKVSCRFCHESWR